MPSTRLWIWGSPVRAGAVVPFIQLDSARGWRIAGPFCLGGCVRRLPDPPFSPDERLGTTAQLGRSQRSQAWLGAACGRSSTVHRGWPSATADAGRAGPDGRHGAAAAARPRITLEAPQAVGRVGARPALRPAAVATTARVGYRTSDRPRGHACRIGRVPGRAVAGLGERTADGPACPIRQAGSRSTT